MVGIGKPRLPRSADLMKMGLICGFSGMYLFFFFFFKVQSSPRRRDSLMSVIV